MIPDHARLIVDTFGQNESLRLALQSIADEASRKAWDAGLRAGYTDLASWINLCFALGLSDDDLGDLEDVKHAIREQIEEITIGEWRSALHPERATDT